MAEVREKAFSTSLTSDVGARVKMIAQRENRSFANVIESAVKVFTLLPKEVRDMLVEAAADAEEGRKRLKELSRSVMHQDAMRTHASSASIEQESEGESFGGESAVGSLEHEDGIATREFEGYRGEAVCGGFQHGCARGRRSGQQYLVDALGDDSSNSQFVVVVEHGQQIAIDAGLRE